MKKSLFLLLNLVGIVSISLGQTVTIGTQVWMTKNLDVDHFRNGDPIPQAKTDEEWKKAGENKQPAWCYYNNDPANGGKYGKLYNWYAVNDQRGLAPEGYHVPSDKEWTVLTNYLGGEDSIEEKMKSTSGWENNNNGTNSSGFNGLSGGYRYEGGTFIFLGYHGGWWSRTEFSFSCAWARNLYDSKVVRYEYDKQRGYSVRCVEDAEPLKTIGTQVWMTKNLNVDHFRNGDPIPHAFTNEQWKNAAEDRQPVWCYINNDPANGAKYGKLYNWYAVNDQRGLAPEGYHVPSDKEWTVLTNYLGGEKGAGDKMKSTSGWIENGNGTNSSGFNGLPGGYRYFHEFIADGYGGIWWSGSMHKNNDAKYYKLLHGNSDLIQSIGEKGCGFSVRCLRD